MNKHRSACRPALAPIALNDILFAVLDATNLRYYDLCPPSVKSREIVMARSAYCVLARIFSTASYSELATGIGSKTHSTMISAHRRGLKMVNEDGPQAELFRAILDVVAELIIGDSRNPQAWDDVWNKWRFDAGWVVPPDRVMGGAHNDD